MTNIKFYKETTIALSPTQELIIEALKSGPKSFQELKQEIDVHRSTLSGNIARLVRSEILYKFTIPTDKVGSPQAGYGLVEKETGRT